MTKALSLAVGFASAAISEALARRATPEGYSAPAEVARLTHELSVDAPRETGLEANGAAMAARADLEAFVARVPDDPVSLVFTRLGLGRTERDVLTLLWAWFFEPRVGSLFGHLHDALQRTRPTVGALAEALRNPIAVGTALGPDSVLRRCGIVELDRSGPDGVLGIDPRIALFLANGTLGRLENPAGRLARAAAPPPSEPTPADETARLEGTDVVVLRGAVGSGRHRFALALAAREGRPALILRLDQPNHDSAPALVDAALRDARILGARLVVSGDSNGALARALAEAEVSLVLVLEPTQRLPEIFLDRSLATMDLELPPARMRAELWGRALGRSAQEPEVEAVAARYAFTPGVIRRAARQAPTLGLEKAARLQLSHELDALVRSCDVVRSWDRLVVPEGTLDALHAICAQVRQRVRVGDDWGFARHHSLGRGVKALFFGRPGTGKTLAAEVVAADLNLPLCRIDLSRIVSKWIGETEQNLARLFDEAEKSQAILFFDEADSLFSRRTAIHSSTDRYANMEVNYLLQRVDAHDGVVILATNFKANLDDAFTRRLHYVVELPEPDAAARERIWKQSVPAKAPLDPGVDLGFFARRFELPGGAIKNAVVGAAYLAAADGGVIERRHLASALRREFTKLDRLCPRAELDALTVEPTRSVA